MIPETQKSVEPYLYLSLLKEEHLQAALQGKERQVELHGFLLLNRWNQESEEPQGVRMCKAEYKRKLH